MIDPAPQTPGRRALYTGALAWIAFAVIAVALRGVRWEEAYEHALVITRTIPYPEGHPFFLYCRNVFSGQSYFAALLMSIVDSPLLINGLRNVLQLSFCAVPVFLLGSRFSGQALMGHIAVVLVLLGMHRGFQSYYPIESWPHFFGTGQIGAGYALLVFAFLLMDRWRTAWFLLGLMPVIHIGQLPVIGLFAGLQWLHALRMGHSARAFQAVAWFALGLAPCVLFYLVQRQFHVDPPAEGAYFAGGDIRAIWAAYTERHDLHRAFPRLNPFWKSWIAVALVLLLSGGMAWRERRNPVLQRPFTWTALFALVLSAVVGGICIVHQLLGADAPFVLIGWMPYRLTNHLAILLVPLAQGVLHCAGDDDHARNAGRALMGLILLYALLLPLWDALLPDTMYTRYAGNLEGLLYVLCGGAIAAVMTSTKDRHAIVAMAAPQLAGALALAAVYPFALATLLVGAASWTILRFAFSHMPARIVARSGQLAIGPGVLLLAALLLQQSRSREHLPVHPLQRDVNAWLDQHGEHDAMLVVPWWDINWLAKTRHPIFTDYQTAHLMSYVPSLAPALKRMHAEVYGFEIDGDSGTPLAAWPGRTPEQWQQLAEAYGFRYVLAPAEMNLKIERVLDGNPYHLYRAAPGPPAG